eukprot:8434384-Heterocapsa_arctica.AAC.1
MGHAHSVLVAVELVHLVYVLDCLAHEALSCDPTRFRLVVLIGLEVVEGDACDSELCLHH